MRVCVCQYAQLKQHAARLEEELEATVGQVEAIKHQMELRTRKWYATQTWRWQMGSYIPVMRKGSGRQLDVNESMATRRVVPLFVHRLLKLTLFVPLCCVWV